MLESFPVTRRTNWRQIAELNKHLVGDFEVDISKKVFCFFFFFRSTNITCSLKFSKNRSLKSVKSRTFHSWKKNSFDYLSITYFFFNFFQLFASYVEEIKQIKWQHWWLAQIMFHLLCHLFWGGGVNWKKSSVKSGSFQWFRFVRQSRMCRFCLFFRTSRNGGARNCDHLTSKGVDKNFSPSSHYLPNAKWIIQSLRFSKSFKKFLQNLIWVILNCEGFNTYHVILC